MGDRIASLSTEMKEAIARSGYLFEQRLVPLIATFGYYPISNYRYRNARQESSELDIYAIAAKEISRPRGHLWSSLLIECKNLRCPLVFFSHKQEMRTTMFLGRPHISGLPQEVHERGRFYSLSDFLKLETFHHYYSRYRVATQFCAVVEKKKGGSQSGTKAKRTSDDYIAGHQVGELDLYRDGISKLNEAVVTDKRDYATRFQKQELADERVDLWLHYPILVTSGPLFECTVSRRMARYRRVHRVGFLHRGTDLSPATDVADCRIDIVDVVGLRDLLRIIGRETGRITELIRKRYGPLSRSRRLVVNKFRLARMKPDEVIRIAAGEISATGQPLA